LTPCLFFEDRGIALKLKPHHRSGINGFKQWIFTRVTRLPLVAKKGESVLVLV
jgi:hypothetical protein